MISILFMIGSACFRHEPDGTATLAAGAVPG